MAKMIAVTNSKGGTGKSTTAINLGAILAERGKKVVLCDCDPQANLTEDLGIKITSVDWRLASNALFSVSCPEPQKMIYQNIIRELPNLYLIPGHTQLVFEDRTLLEGLLEEEQIRAEKGNKSVENVIRKIDAECKKCINDHDRELFSGLSEKLKKQVSSTYSEEEYETLTRYDEALVLFKNIKKYQEVFEFFDYVIFDLNTYMSMVAENALAVSDSLICVTDPSIDGLRGVMTFTGLWARIAKRLHISIEDMNQCIILNKYKSTTRFSKKIMSILNGEFGDDDGKEKELFEEFHDYYIPVPIPDSTKFPEAASERVPLIIARKRRQELLDNYETLDPETKKKYKPYLLRREIEKLDELIEIMNKLTDKLFEEGIF